MEQNNLQQNIGITLGIIIVCGVLFVTIFWGRQSSNTAITTLDTSTTSQNTPSTINTTNTPVSTTPIPKTPTTTTPTVKPTPPVTQTSPSYTLAQVATHSSASSCWSIIQNNVYDLTSWINQHPGGARAILSICGKDGTSAFEQQHGGQARPESELKNFLIGVYSK